MKYVFVFATLLLSTHLQAEEFLGLENNTDAEGPAQEEAPAQAEPAGPAGTWGGSGGLWGGTNQFRAALTVSYYWNPYIGLETHGYYHQFQSSDYTGKMYGPEVDLVLRGANPTMITPFVGAGLGFDRWARSYKDELFDDASSVTAVAMAGISISLTKHFGLQAVRKQKVYLADPPLSFADRTKREEHSRITNYVGFVVMF